MNKIGSREALLNLLKQTVQLRVFRQFWPSTHLRIRSLIRTFHILIQTINTIAPFRKEAERLIKKYPSLKTEHAEIGNKLPIIPEWECRLEITAKK
ncbi:MAG TPA: hypothetical protein VI603_08335 [Saprospiraceae bacterium]|nr:hypothetical protein [Saprospiraceae bacterium]